MSETDDTTIISKDGMKLKSAALLGKRGLLVVLSKNHFGRTCVVDTPHVTIGRQNECSLAIPDPQLSRKHCEVTVDEKGDFHIEDLGSTNSTFLNNKKIAEKCRLQYGDRIVIGHTIIRFYLEEELEKKQ